MRKMILNWFGKYGMWALGAVYALWLILLGMFLGVILGVSALF